MSCRGVSVNTGNREATTSPKRSATPDATRCAPARGTHHEAEMDIAAAIQKVLEEFMLTTVRHVYAKTNLKNLYLAGGVVLNRIRSP